MDYLSDLFLLRARTGIYWDETPYHCSLCGKTHKPRPGIVCRAFMDKRLTDHRAAMAQLIKEYGMQDERMVFCGSGFGKKSFQPKIVVGVDAGSPENSMSKLRGVKAFLDEMKAARKPTRLCRNARLKRHRERYQKWVSDNVKTVLTRYPDPITGKIVPQEQAIEEQIDMRFALKNLVHDGLKIGDVLGKRSLDINSTFGHTSIYCNGREVVCFGMFQGPPRKYQRNGWMLLRHLEKIAARRPKARWTVTMCHAGKEFSATWERKRPKHWVITRIDDPKDYTDAFGMEW